MQQKTEQHRIKAQVYIWAYPEEVYDYDVGERVLTGKWVYEANTDSRIYRKGAVQVDKQEVWITCPGGVDLAFAAYDTLKKERKAMKEEFEEKDAKLAKQMEQLLLLTYDKQDDMDNENIIEMNTLNPHDL